MKKESGTQSVRRAMTSAQLSGTSFSRQWLPDVGPYTFVSREATVNKNAGKSRRSFRIIIYGAYNAMGLIGSECNGIAILDNDSMRVLCDEIMKQPSGYFGPSHGQVQVFERLLKMKWADFQSFVNASRRNRYTI